MRTRLRTLLNEEGWGVGGGGGGRKVTKRDMKVITWQEMGPSTLQIALLTRIVINTVTRG